MKKYSSLEYLKLTKLQRFFYKLKCFFAGIPLFFKKIGLAIGRFFKKLGIGIKNEVLDIINTFRYGDWKTRTSYVVMGFGSFARKQIGRGILFFGFMVAFIIYMIFGGAYWLSMMPSLGKVGPSERFDPDLDVYVPVYGDNSFKILLYSVLTIFIIIAFIYTWRLNIKQNRINEQITGAYPRKVLTAECKQAIKVYKKENSNLSEKELNEGIALIEQEYQAKLDKIQIKKVKSTKDDLKSLVDDEFHKTLLALPLVGILIFTVMPIIFMILVAFTNYSGKYNGYTNNLFHWVGMDNFNTVLSWGNSSGKSFSATFGEVLAWTLIWAVFATFSNYFLGMLVAIVINKKGIKLKKTWRTVLVLTIAIPQFISLMYVAKLFSYTGFINGVIQNLGGTPVHFMDDMANPWTARICVILINIWIGIPYLMLIATGILMNIPEDLYESSKIDGANVWQQYMKITLPYMLFVTGPYLLTSFTGNMNNFNVIYLLTGGAPTMPDGPANSASVGSTDLLITWLFKITTTSGSNYYLASVIGIMVFVVVAVISLIVYNIIPSNKNEEDFQ